MGCDIHAYIEKVETFNDGCKHATCWARLSLQRDYTLFALLAGVRYHPRAHGFSAGKTKGLPPDVLSYRVKEDAFLRIVDGEREDERTCTRADVESWPRYDNLCLPHPYYGDHSDQYVMHPDWHSHSWMTVAELEQAQRHYSSPDLFAVLGAMRALNGDEPERSRLVFWFDN
jgi:hypothetical protein